MINHLRSLKQQAEKLYCTGHVHDFFRAESLMEQYLDDRDSYLKRLERLSGTDRTVIQSEINRGKL